MLCVAKRVRYVFLLWYLSTTWLSHVAASDGALVNVRSEQKSRLNVHFYTGRMSAKKLIALVFGSAMCMGLLYKWFVVNMRSKPYQDVMTDRYDIALRKIYVEGLNVEDIHIMGDENPEKKYFEYKVTRTFGRPENSSDFDEPSVRVDFYKGECIIRGRLRSNINRWWYIWNWFRPNNRSMKIEIFASKGTEIEVSANKGLVEDACMPTQVHVAGIDAPIKVENFFGKTIIRNAGGALKVICSQQMRKLLRKLGLISQAARVAILHQRDGAQGDIELEGAYDFSIDNAGGNVRIIRDYDDGQSPPVTRYHDNKRSMVTEYFMREGHYGFTRAGGIEGFGTYSETAT